MSTLTKASELLDTGGIDAVTKAQVLLEALPYVQRFRGATFVVKYGGSFMDDPDPVLAERVANDIVFLAAVGIDVVVVHGGGKAISRAMERASLEPVFKEGLRVTDEKAIAVVEQTLNGEVNPSICKLLESQGGKAQGLPGNQVLVAEPREIDGEGRPTGLGYVGRIIAVKTKMIRKALREGLTPVVSPVAANEEKQAFNTNADAAAAAVATALRARRLVYLCDVPGLMQDPAEPSTLISTLYRDEVEELKESGVIAKGMRPKIDSAVEALDQGVHRVHLIDGRMPHSLLLEIFTDQGIGTELVLRNEV